MLEQLQHLTEKAQAEITEASNLQALEQIRVHYLGKKSQLTEVLKGVGQLPSEERPKLGEIVNKTKEIIQNALKERQSQLTALQLNQQLEKEAVDVTLPGRDQSIGSIHPIAQVTERLQQLFLASGFEIVEGPEVEDEYHNFTALNIPEHHPARAMHDTFYLENGMLLRTHTSPVQIRAMKERKPPLRIIAPGLVYRCDSDIRHTPMFHQLEGLWVDDRCTFADLKGLLHELLEQFLERHLQVRFRPSYFPFTEPSAEVDMECVICSGEGCRTCSQSGWLEVLGCGMIHPNVLQNVGIDSELYTGFAFGVGIDRLTMLRYGIDDLRILFEND